MYDTADADGKGNIHYCWANSEIETPREEFLYYQRLEEFDRTIAISLISSNMVRAIYSVSLLEESAALFKTKDAAEIV